MNNYKITYSTELMQNYLHAEIMNPEAGFQALQTKDGNALLFSIGTDNSFYVTAEVPGIRYGWSRSNLSKDFGGLTGATCKDFSVAQCTNDDIHMAMVLSDSQNDHLYLSLGNSTANTSWITQPAWIAYPYDDPKHERSQVKIVRVFLSEASDGEYIVVDVIRDPNSAEKLIFRYYIDVNKEGGYAWHSNDVPVDVEVGQYASCLGRKGNQGYSPIDGIYTSGKVDGRSQFVYTPLFNVWAKPGRSQPPASDILNLPGSVIPDAIAACRNADNTSDLYVAAAGQLFYFSSTNQESGATAVLVAQNALFNGVRSLFAFATDTGSVTVWGLNANDQIFYTTCPLSQLTATPSAWSVPLPILAGVEQVSPFLNRAYSNNSFFAHIGENKLTKAVKSPDTKMWNFRDITLPPLDATAPAQKFSSYTTRIQLDDAQNQSVPNLPVKISATNVTSVYINHLYYVVSPTPIEVNTDTLGSITIVESVHTLTGTQFTVQVDDATVKINPMDQPFQKATSLTTADQLKNATITNRDGTTKPLLPPSTSDADLNQLASSNQQISKAYASVADARTTGAAPVTAHAMAIAMPTPLADIESVLVDAGDFFSWLGHKIESGADYFVRLVEDAATGVWTFFAKIADEAYHTVLDCVENVVAAVEWLYNTVKTAIEDLIQFLEFLFGWEDILITHRVMKNVFTQLVHKSINSLSDLETDITSVFKSLQNDVNKWANIPNFDQTPDSTTTSQKPLTGLNSAPAHLGLHHYQGNVADSSSSFTTNTITEDIFKDLMDLLDSEEATLTGAYDAIKTDIIDQFGSLTVTQIIQKLIAIVVDTLLQTAENILLAVVKVFKQLIEGFMDLLTVTIDIPVLSWLYKEISGDDLSFLDLICLISAIPATIVYKIGSSAAGASLPPFPKNDSFTNGLLNAQSFQQIQDLFFTTPDAVNRRAIMSAMDTMSAQDNRVLNESRLKTFGIVSGLFAFSGSIVLIITTGIQRILDVAVPFAESTKRTIALVSAIGNVAYVSPNIATLINAPTVTWYGQMNNVITGISIVKGFVNIGLCTLDSAKPLSKVSPAVESIINLAWNVPVIMNIIDNKDRWNTNYKSLIPESIGNFAFNIGGIMEFPIAQTKDIDAKAIESLVQFGFMGVYGICMPVAGGIYEWVPDQNHQ